MDDEKLILNEIQIYKDMVVQHEASHNEHKRLVIELTNKYLDSFNNLLEYQSEVRDSICRTSEEILHLKERINNLELYVDQLKVQNTLFLLTTLKSTDDDLKKLGYKEILTSTQVKLKLIVTGVYLLTIFLLGILSTLLIEYLKK